MPRRRARRPNQAQVEQASAPVRSWITPAQGRYVGWQSQPYWQPYVATSATTTADYSVFRWPVADFTSSVSEWTDAQHWREWAYAQRYQLPLTYNRPHVETLREPPERVPEFPQLSRAAAIERERAIERAELLLRECLSPAQVEELDLHGRITVATYDKQGRPRIFKLRRGRVANILEVNAQGGPVCRWCVHPRLDVPDADTMLGQKLWLEHDCDELLRIANRHPV